MLSNTLKKRFIKDFGLPIQVTQEPYFHYYLKLYDEHLCTLKKYKMFIDIVHKLKEDGFFKELNHIKDSIINDINHLDVYAELAKNKLDEYNIKSNIKQQNIYSIENVGKSFISIDLKHANFLAFKYYNEELVLNANSYEDLIKKYSNEEYFIQSKYLRQVIFGNLMPKKQQKIQKFLINNIINALAEKYNIDEKDFISASSDEVVIAISKRDENFVKSIKEFLNNKFDFSDFIKVQTFTLYNIGDKPFFYKLFPNEKVEFKAIPTHFFAQAYKKFIKQQITEYDKKFFFEGMLATFDKDIFENWECFRKNKWFN